jgi:hypothetical protein
LTANSSKSFPGRNSWISLNRSGLTLNFEHGTLNCRQAIEQSEAVERLNVLNGLQYQ